MVVQPVPNFAFWLQVSLLVTQARLDTLSETFRTTAHCSQELESGKSFLCYVPGRKSQTAGGRMTSR